jgi:hypothetical protein
MKSNGGFRLHESLHKSSRINADSANYQAAKVQKKWEVTNSATSYISNLTPYLGLEHK